MTYLDFPLHFDRRGRTALVDRDGHIRDMIEQLLFTNVGERVNRPEFGSGLLQLVFAPGSQELAAAVRLTLQAALQTWLGDLIEVLGCEVAYEEGVLTILVAYRLRDEPEPRTVRLSRRV